jgi:hypothetical protein
MTNTPKPELPPGPSYIVGQLLSWKATGYVSSVVLIYAGADAIGVCAPVWAFVASSVIALPAILYVQSELQYWRDKRTAATLGARLAPRVSGKRLFGMDVVAAILEAHDSGYIGEPNIPTPAGPKLTESRFRRWGRRLDGRIWSNHRYALHGVVTCKFMCFERHLQRWLTDAADFDVGTVLPQGTRRDYMECHHLPTENFRRSFCLRVLKTMRRVKCLGTVISRCSVPESSTQMVCIQILFFSTDI